MPLLPKFILLACLAAVVLPAAHAITELKPTRDDEVVETLPVITRQRPVLGPAGGQMAATLQRDVPGAIRQARQDIAVARQTGDTRYWGRAQAALLPWWNRSDAPIEVAVLQATVQQGRHEFDASRVVLTAALAKAPGHAQGWLNLAALERLSARYAQSLDACAKVASAGQALYATACRLETASLQGEHAAAVSGLDVLAKAATDTGQRSWLLSLLAESRERAGQDGSALEAYRQSLAGENDLYTTIALSDLLLRTGKATQALELLAPLPETDAVVLRRATALQRMGDDRWKAGRALLRDYSAELVRRGDDPALHGRELALAALWLDGDAPAALALAQRNLQLQREPIDWWVALESARLAGNNAAVADISAAIRTAGLQDVRLHMAGSVK